MIEIDMNASIQDSGNIAGKKDALQEISTTNEGSESGDLAAKLSVFTSTSAMNVDPRSFVFGSPGLAYEYISNNARTWFKVCSSVVTTFN